MLVFVIASPVHEVQCNDFGKGVICVVHTEDCGMDGVVVKNCFGSKFLQVRDCTSSMVGVSAVG